jgi:hypothetical protein
MIGSFVYASWLALDPGLQLVRERKYAAVVAASPIYRHSIVSLPPLCSSYAAAKKIRNRVPIVEPLWSIVSFKS